MCTLIIFLNILLLSPALETRTDVVDFAKSYGYFADSHDVTTSDGYILSLHRLLHPSVDLKKSFPEPFILQHGLFANSAQWAELEPKQNLAFMLADKGFDVWMTNVRGTMYGRKHVRLSPRNADFWDFSWHHHGVYDMPAIIDYILNTTKHKKVWYSGHSMGATMFFVLGSMRPEYNSKMRHMYALAPAVYMSHVGSQTVKVLARNVRMYKELGKALNNHISPELLVVQFFRLGLCKTFDYLCSQGINAEFGYNPKSNITVIKKSIDYFPDYVSVGQLVHYGQLVNQEFTFRMFDYYEANTLKYNAREPPTYPVEKITTPMTLFYSANDNYVATVDVEQFSKRLANVTLYMVSDKNFNHLDYISSTYADEVVYKPMLQMIEDEQNRRHTDGS